MAMHWRIAFVYHRNFLVFHFFCSKHLGWKKDEEYQEGVFSTMGLAFCSAVAGYGSILSAILLHFSTSCPNCFAG